MKNAFLFLLAIVGGGSLLCAQCTVELNIPYEACNFDAGAFWTGEVNCVDAVSYTLDLDYFCAGGDYLNYCADACPEGQSFEAATWEELQALVGSNVNLCPGAHSATLDWHFGVEYADGSTDIIGSYTTNFWQAVYSEIVDECPGAVIYQDNSQSGYVPNIADNPGAYFVAERASTGPYGTFQWVVAATDNSTTIISAGDPVCAPLFEHSVTFEGLDLEVNCMDATPLVSNELQQDLLVCGNLSTTYGCAEFSGDQTQRRTQMWFVLNSGTESEVNFGMDETSNTLEVYENAYAVVLVDGPAPGCDDLEVVTCSDAGPPYSFSVSDYAEVLPNTDYYFVVYGFPTTEISVIGSAGELAIDYTGCTDPNSCVYDPSPVFEYCPVQGCTDPDACNYSSSAECDNGTCSYPAEAAIQVYHDENYNGVYSWNDDAIGGFGEVVLAQNGEVIYTVIPNLEGEGTVVDPINGEYQVYFSDPGEGWIPFDTLTFNLPQCDEVELGVIPTPDTFDQYSTFVGTASTELHCEFGLYVGFWMLNTGTEPLDGTVTIGYEDVLEVSPLGTVWSDNTDGVATWNITGHPPGIARYYALDVEGPPVEFIGQAFPFEVSVEITDDAGTVIYAASQSTEATVTCAYDPNDITLISPQTYFDPEFIDDDTETAVYRIRFQNTGNAPASDVVVVDELDDALFDLSSFAPLSGSHEFHTIPEPDGRVSFVFENINLPDSTADLEGSQGEVYFQIDLLESVQPEDWVSNSAEIYFDSNPPIYTNVASHQLFNCDWMEVSYTADFCGPSPVLNPSPLLTTEYEWPGTGIVNDVLPVDDPEPGTTTVPILLSNPMCAPQEAFVTYTWQAYLPEDLDQNGSVDSNDFLTVLGTFGCAGSCMGDITLDTVVGTLDLLAVIAAFGLSCE